MSDRELIANLAAVVAGAVHDDCSESEQIARYSVALARAIVAEVDRTQPEPEMLRHILVKHAKTEGCSCRQCAYVRPPPTAMPGDPEPR